MEFESHCLWGLHPRNESRVGLFINNERAYERPLSLKAEIQFLSGFRLKRVYTQVAIEVLPYRLKPWTSIN